MPKPKTFIRLSDEVSQMITQWELDPTNDDLRWKIKAHFVDKEIEYDFNMRTVIRKRKPSYRVNLTQFEPQIDGYPEFRGTIQITEDLPEYVFDLNLNSGTMLITKKIFLCKDGSKFCPLNDEVTVYQNEMGRWEYSCTDGSSGIVSSSCVVTAIMIVKTLEQLLGILPNSIDYKELVLRDLTDTEKISQLIAEYIHI